MGAVPDLVAAPLEPARQRDLYLALDGTPEERGRRLAGAADDDVRAGRGARTPRSGSTAIVPSWTTASFSAAISSRVSPRTSVCSSADVREQDDVRAEDVGRVEPAAEPRLDDRDVDVAPRELRERGRADRLELRRLLRLGLGPDASDRRLEVDLLAVDA